MADTLDVLWIQLVKYRAFHEGDGFVTKRLTLYCLERTKYEKISGSLKYS
jgi:hypothetical protein